MFEVRIYPVEAQVGKILERIRKNEPDTRSSTLSIKNLDIKNLNRALHSINFNQIRKRRELYNRLFEEALILQEPGRGISFMNMLVLLSQYKLIDDEKALK